MSDAQTDRELIIRGCEYWVKNHKDESLPLAYSSVVELLALLKEQEAVEPVTESSVYDPDTWWFECGSCKKGIISPGDKFCRWCGKPILWEGR